MAAVHVMNLSKLVSVASFHSILQCYHLNNQRQLRGSCLLIRIRTNAVELTVEGKNSSFLFARQIHSLDGALLEVSDVELYHLHTMMATGSLKVCIIDVSESTDGEKYYSSWVLLFSRREVLIVIKILHQLKISRTIA
jgi:hypothetical protein